MDPSNPYATPASAGGPPSGGDPRAAEEMLNIPSILLIIVGSIGILAGLNALVQDSGTLPPELLEKPEIAQFKGVFEGLLTYNKVWAAIGMALNALIVFAAIKMRKLEIYGLALAAAIIAIIPCFNCCCLPMPAGIWALVILLKPEVKASFR